MVDLHPPPPALQNQGGSTPAVNSPAATKETTDSNRPPRRLFERSRPHPQPHPEPQQGKLVFFSFCRISIYGNHWPKMEQFPVLDIICHSGMTPLLQSLDAPRHDVPHHLEVAMAFPV